MRRPHEPEDDTATGTGHRENPADVDSDREGSESTLLRGNTADALTKVRHSVHGSQSERPGGLVARATNRAAREIVRSIPNATARRPLLARVLKRGDRHRGRVAHPRASTS